GRTDRLGHRGAMSAEGSGAAVAQGRAPKCGSRCGSGLSGSHPSRSTVRVSVSHGSDAILHRQQEREDDDGEQEEGSEAGRSGAQEEENNKGGAEEDDQKGGQAGGAQAQSRAAQSPGSRAGPGAGTDAVLSDARQLGHGRRGEQLRPF